ncbi:MAG: sulfotransferase [Planctomycetota bacterium]
MIANTFIIGAMKSATTGLCDILAHHPDAFICCPKEPDFFSRDEEYAKGIGWYETLFRASRGCQVVGDGSTSYAKQWQYPSCAERMAKHAPDAKLIYMARNPIKRIQSHWSHEVLKGRTSLSLQAFVRNHPEAIDISCYWKQIDRYRDHFPDQQIFVVFFEDYCQATQLQFDRCCDFLGLSRLRVDLIEIDRNTTSQRRKDVAPIRMLRRYRWFDARFEQIKQATPRGVRGIMKTVLKSRHGGSRPQWDQPTLQWVQDQLFEDNQRFLKHFGKPANYWQSVSAQEAGV